MFSEFRHKLRTQRFYCAVYILGTALSVASVMLFVIFIHIRLSPIYPEVNRSNTYYIDSVVRIESDGRVNESGCIPAAFTDSIRRALGPDAKISVSYPDYFYASVQHFTTFAGRPDTPVQIMPRFTDPEFFRIYEFEFLEGGPFSAADLESGLRHAVITDRLARRVFGSATGVVGRDIPINHTTFKVVGVVREASVLCEDSFAQIYMPYTSMPQQDWSRLGCCLGKDALTIVTNDRDKLESVVNELVRRHNSSVTDGHIMRLVAGMTPHANLNAIGIFIVFIVLFLVVPSLNLSGLIAGDMDARLPEMGIRKAFGARRGRLLRRIIVDNIALSTIGGLTGLILAWIGMSSWAWRFSSSHRLPSVDVTVNSDMLFSFGIFAAAFLFCMLVNVASSFIPAWWSLRKPAVQALNENKR